MADIPKDHLDLVMLGHYVGLLLVFFVNFRLTFVLVLWTQREATVALEEEPDVLELVVEVLGIGLLVKLVHDQFVEDATEAPHVRGLVILFFDDRDLRSSVPTRSHMEGHESLLSFPSGSVLK